MKNYINRILLASVLGLTTVSCTNLLEDVNPDALPETPETLTDIRNLQQLLNNTYQTMPLASEGFIQALMTDELKIATTNNGSGVFLWGRTFTSQDGDVEGLWYSAYRTIFTANKVLDNIDTVNNDGITWNSTVLSKNQIKAEALGMRAFNHMLILENFSPKYSANALGCVYMKTAKDITYGTPPRDNMQTSYQNVLADLNAALALNPSNTNNKYISRDALNAMKAQVYLEMNDYPNAITAANLAIGSKVLKGASVTYDNVTGVPSMVNNVAPVWADPIAGAGTMNGAVDGSEVIFQQINIVGAASVNIGGLYTSPSLGTFWSPSTTLLPKYNAADLRRAAYLNSNTVFKKYYGTTQNRGIANVKAIRTAEIILLRAEAKAKGGDLPGAYNDYLLVRKARNGNGTNTLVPVPTGGYAVQYTNDAAFTSATDAIDKILEERFREFPLEGKRLSDLKRNGKIVTRAASDATAAYPNTTFPNVDKMTLPIPYSEIFANPNIQQNVGW